MNHLPTPPNRPPRNQALLQRAHRDAPRRASPLTDDQYLATSLALVADLSRRVRQGASRHG